MFGRSLGTSFGQCNPFRRSFTTWPRFTRERHTTPLHRASRSLSVSRKTPIWEPGSPEEPLSEAFFRRARSLRPVLFALGVSGSAYFAAAYYTNECTKSYAHLLASAIGGWRRQDPPTTPELMAIRRFALKAKLVKGLNWLKEQTSRWPPVLAQETLAIYVMWANSWLAMPEGKRTCYGITTINTLVFLAWQIPRLKSFMLQHFTHNPLSGKSYTLLTSIFSHQSFIHLLFNSLALLSFGAAFEVADSQRPSVLHQPHPTDRYHFLAFYLGVGLFSGALSHAIATRIRLPRLLSALSNPTRVKSMDPSKVTIRPSLGASGAIYGTVAMTVMAMPETHVTLIFFPWFPIPSQVGFAGAVALDILGIIRGWKIFDHWAHLGGAMAGMAYFFYGPWEIVRAKLWSSF